MQNRKKHTLDASAKLSAKMSRRTKPILWLTAASFASVGYLSCTSAVKKAYRPDELRSAVAGHLEEMPPGDLVIPFEVDPKYIDMAKRVTRRHVSRLNRAKALVKAMFSRSHFNLKYADMETHSANETLRTGKGNCMALSSVFVGLARAVGMEAYYLDVSARIHDTHQDEKLVVRRGHITTVVSTEQGLWMMHVGQRFRVINYYRVMDDLEAMAHFYNNRGYQLIHWARQAGEKIDWDRVIRMFRVATHIKPSFYRAWNNLGVAFARTGRTKQAEQCYLKAIAEKKRFASPHFNLGVLYLSARNYPKAVRYLETAAKLESDSSHIHFHHGMALLGSGHTNAAEDAFERAIDLNKTHQRAHKFLKKIDFYNRIGRIPNPDD